MGRPPYRFCPYCATPLQLWLVAGQTRPACPTCAFIQFDDPKVAVTAVVEHKGRLLLVRRANNPGKGLWALPGGYMDAGELPDAALRREIMEEVAPTIAVRDLLAIYPLQVQDASIQGIVLVYSAKLVDSTRSAPAAQDDVAEARWFAAGELPVDLAFASTRELLDRWSGANTIQKEPSS